MCAWSLQFDALRQRGHCCQLKRTVWYPDEVDVEVARSVSGEFPLLVLTNHLLFLFDFGFLMSAVEFFLVG